MHHSDHDAHVHGFTGTNAAEPYPKAKTMRDKIKFIAVEMLVGLLCGIGFATVLIGSYFLLRGAL